MHKAITTLTLSLLFFYVSKANDYEDAWTAINKKNFKEAKLFLQKATQDPATSIDAYLTLLFLQTYQGNENDINGLIDRLSKSSDKNSYFYSMWFNGAVLGDYSKKKPYQLNLLNKIFSDASFNGSMQAAAHYVKAMHYVFSNEYIKAIDEWTLMGAIQNWQLTGPFENLSGSGFNGSYGPLSSADAETKVIGANNVEVNWFTPLKLNKEGWIFTYAHLPQQSAIVYAQSFVNAPEEMKILLNAGANGAIKIWVNDGLVISESKERVTELDYYKNYCTLKKGYNSILIQLGYTNNSLPNFIIRFTDQNYNTIKGLTSTAQKQAYIKNSNAETANLIKHFAEVFFEKKIAEEPRNLVNYILLSQTFLRDGHTTEARQTMEKALSLSPNNPLLKFELIQCLLKSENRTALAQEVEWLKENDPESYVNYQIKIQNFISEEKYTEAEEELKKMRSLYGEDENIMQLKASILGKLERVDELVELVNRNYTQNPENLAFLGMMFRLKKLINKDNKAALNVYENYLKTNFNYDVITQLANEYKAQGMNDKYVEILKKLKNVSGYDPRFASNLLNYYYENRNYSKALEYAEEALQLAPFTGTYWSNKALVHEAMNNKNEAITAYKKAIYFDRTTYEARKKLNVLEQKIDLYKLLPETDAYALMKKPLADMEHDFSYLLDEKGIIIYDEGASEEYVSYMAKLHTQKGIDSWKELYVPYNSNTQTLLIEKSEVIKANGSKVPAERNEEHIVFTGLEPGDAVYVKYRIQNYGKGRLGREFWDRFTFNSFVPSATARYTLVVPKAFKFNAEVINAKIEPSVKNVNDFTVYTWEDKNITPLKREPLMPPLNDVGAVLHISTVKTWADVANWYSDLSYQNTAENFELETLYKEIFDKAPALTNFEKAKRIYNYIVTNIRYSSVSFRQSNFVPQNVSKTISTKLGDCKDLSTLFVSLLNKAGIQGQLVLVDTRDNGSKDMLLPSMEFNHCIALAKIDGKDYYIELTDSNLPFGSLPSTLYGALTLVIPSQGQKSNAELKPLVAVNKTADRSIKHINVSIVGKDEKFTIVSSRFGSLTSAWRESYATLSEANKKKNTNNLSVTVIKTRLSWKIYLLQV